MRMNEDFALGGLWIRESTFIFPVPIMQVSQRFRELQSPELVRSTNQWLLERFGTRLPTYLLGGNVVVMHPTTLAELKHKLEKQK